MDGDYQTSLDLAQVSHTKVKTLIDLEVLLLDEVSMLDGDGHSAIEELLSITDHNRRPSAGSHDAIGNMHLLPLSCDHTTLNKILLFQRIQLFARAGGPTRRAINRIWTGGLAALLGGHTGRPYWAALLGGTTGRAKAIRRF